MYKVFALTLLTWFSCVFVLSAANTTIKGHIPDYRNKKFNILTHSDFITMNTDTLAQVTVDQNGDFSVTINQVETQSIFIPLGYYKGLLLIEPGQTYEVQFPPIKNLGPSEMLNPFFEPEEVYLNIINLEGRELNTFSRNFDEVYDQYLINATPDLLKKGKQSDVDTFIVFMNEKFDLDSINYFKQHKDYRFARLRGIAYEKNPKAFFTKYFANRPILWHNETYFQVFKTSSNSFYNDFASSPQGGGAHDSFTKDEDPMAMIRALTSLGKLQSDTLSSLVLIYNIYTRFYREAISKDFAVKTMKTIANSSKIPMIRKIANIVYKRLICLMPGYPAPEFTMKDINGKDAQLRLFKGKYLYLHFYSAKSYTARQDLPLLNELYQKFNKWLEIVTIAPKEDMESLQKINKKNEFNWTFLFYEKDNSLLQTYKIKSYPTYYMLDTENNILLSPAPAPTEEFEHTVSELVMEKERDKQRKKKE